VYTISKEPVCIAGFINVSASRVCFGWCTYCKWTHQIHTYHDPGVRFCYFGWEWSIFSCVFSPSFLYDILDEWNINNQCSTSCVRPGHVMEILMVFSVLVYHGWSKYSWYQDSILCYLYQWLRNLYLVCNKAGHILQYVMLRNEVGLITFLFILVPWLFLVLWRSMKYTLGLLICH
jgi:hypothetical protein